MQKTAPTWPELATLGAWPSSRSPWTDTPYRAPVLDRNGQEIGRTESLLGDEKEDIFHGLAVSGAQHHQVVMVPAEHVTRITTQHVETDLDAAGSPRWVPTRRSTGTTWGGVGSSASAPSG